MYHTVYDLTRTCIVTSFCEKYNKLFCTVNFIVQNWLGRTIIETISNKITMKGMRTKTTMIPLSDGLKEQHDGPLATNGRLCIFYAMKYIIF